MQRRIHWNLVEIYALARLANARGIDVDDPYVGTKLNYLQESCPEIKPDRRRNLSGRNTVEKVLDKMQELLTEDMARKKLEEAQAANALLEAERQRADAEREQQEQERIAAEQAEQQRLAEEAAAATKLAEERAVVGQLIEEQPLHPLNLMLQGICNTLCDQFISTMRTTLHARIKQEFLSMMPTADAALEVIAKAQQTSKPAPIETPAPSALTSELDDEHDDPPMPDFHAAPSPKSLKPKVLIVGIKESVQKLLIAEFPNLSLSFISQGESHNAKSKIENKDMVVSMRWASHSQIDHVRYHHNYHHLTGGFEQLRHKLGEAMMLSPA